jgi:PIN domain nuclease of toxin-antitoxin system
MSDFVFDASALLAVLQMEPGHERMLHMLDGAYISTVNIAEVLSKLAERDKVTKQDVRDIESFGLEIVDLDIEQASVAAALRSHTRHLGLSLGDRSCLALAIIKGATAITTDKAWKKVDLCPVKVMR